MKRFWQASKVADEIGISLCTLRRWVAAGLGPPHRKLPSGRILFKPDEVRTWLADLDVPRPVDEEQER